MEIIRKIRVKFGYVFSLLLIAIAKPRSFFWFWVGAAIASAGEALRVWASTHIVKLDELTKSGPYSATRNPLYFGSFLLGCGLLVIVMNATLALIYFAFFAFIYPITIMAEAKELEEKFGADYREYRQNTPAFAPTPSGLFEALSELRHLPREIAARFKNFIRNREYNGVIALVLTLAFLYYRLKNSRSK